MAENFKTILGKKVGMTQIWDESNKHVPVTVIKIPDIRIVQVKTVDTDGYNSLKVTYGYKKEDKLTKPQLGVYKSAKVEPGEKLLELRTPEVNGFKVGDELKADSFKEGDLIDVTAISKGKGFTGVMKRHNFKGQGGAHGNHKKHRAPGSIGACATPARVFKGLRMAGRSGASKVTILNLKVVKADPESELILVKGAVPGPKGATVILRSAKKARKQ